MNKRVKNETKPNKTNQNKTKQNKAKENKIFSTNLHFRCKLLSTFSLQFSDHNLLYFIGCTFCG